MMNTDLPKKRFSRHKPASNSGSSANHLHHLTASHLNHLNNNNNNSNDATVEESLSSITTQSPGSSTLNEDRDKKEMKIKLLELSSLFLGIRRSMVKGLITDSMDGPGVNVDSGTLMGQSFADNEQHSIKKLSSSTLVRAERVKFTIELYYVYLRRQIVVKRLDPVTNEPLYPHVEGVYNPLQVIRNRKLYKKYKQIPKRLDLKLITPASQAFSERKDKRLKWQVDINEQVHDFNFRTQHFHELRSPSLELWFPPYAAELPTEQKSPRLHEKMFDFPIINIEDEEGRAGRTITQSTSSRSSSRRLKRFSRSPFRYSNSNSNSHSKLVSLPDLQMTTPPPDLRNHSKVSSSSASENSNSNLLLSPIKSVNIKHYNHPRGGEESSSSIVDINQRPSLEDDRILLGKLQNMLKRLHGLVSLGELNFQNKPRYLDNKVENFIHFKNKELDTIMANYQNFNNDVIEFESTVNEVNDSTTTYKTHLINQYLNKIDVLLSLSDRTIGEINTSLTLETRRLKERLEKLDSNLYSSLTGDNKNDFLIKLSYYLLENLIGLLLLIIWFLYTIFRSFQFVIVGFYKILKWLIY